MKILLAYNPIAGRGKARAEAAKLAERLGDDSVTVQTTDSPDHADDGAPDAIVVLGGDGTVHAFADMARRLDAPIYQFPLGTENLFAREFGMNRRYDTLRRAIDKHQVERVDLATCNGHTFLLMVSVGPDAGVIHRLAAVRKGSIHHLSYAPHILFELTKPSLAPLTIFADGDTIVENRQGLVVVANSRQYAMRINPAKDASMRDGLLDIVFFPISTRLGLLKWLALSRLRMQERNGHISTRAREIVIQGHNGPLTYQFDGEAGHHPGQSDTADTTSLRLAVQPRALPVLIP